MEVYNIQPVQISGLGTTYTATKIMMAVNYTIGMTEMTVPFSLLDASDASVWNGNVDITETELNDWGTNDMYIVNLVAQKAGVTLV